MGPPPRCRVLRGEPLPDATTAHNLCPLFMGQRGYRAAPVGRRPSKIVTCETVAVMQRVRALVIVAVLAGLLLSGCQAQRRTRRRRSATSRSPTRRSTPRPRPTRRPRRASPTGRRSATASGPSCVSSWSRPRCSTRLARRYAAEKGLPAPAVDYAATAQRLGVPADNPFTKIVADSDAYRQMLLSRAAAGQPTDEDMRDAYDRYVKAATNAGVEPVPFDDIRNELVADSRVRPGHRSAQRAGRRCAAVRGRGEPALPAARVADLGAVPVPARAGRPPARRERRRGPRPGLSRDPRRSPRQAASSCW